MRAIAKRRGWLYAKYNRTSRKRKSARVAQTVDYRRTTFTCLWTATLADQAGRTTNNSSSYHVALSWMSRWLEHTWVGETRCTFRDPDPSRRRVHLISKPGRGEARGTAAGDKGKPDDLLSSWPSQLTTGSTCHGPWRLQGSSTPMLNGVCNLRDLLVQERWR